MNRIEIFDTWQMFGYGLSHTLRKRGFTVLGVKPSSRYGFSWDADLFLIAPEAVQGVTVEEFISVTSRVGPVLLLTTTEKVNDYHHLASLGVCGIVDRNSDAETFCRAIDQAAKGGAFFTSCGDEPSTDGKPSTTTTLSRREQEVLRYIADGMTHRQIARTLHISPHTIDTYVRRIRSKLGVGNKAEITRIAMLSEAITAAE